MILLQLIGFEKRILLLTIVFSTISSATVSEELRRILQDYDRRERPSINGSTCNVISQLGIVGLGPIDEMSLTVKMDVFMRHWWKDSRLRLRNKTVITLSEDPSSLIWVPDTYFPNAVKTKTHKSIKPNLRLKIDKSGNVYMSKRFTVKYMCLMNLHLYPFDKQICDLFIESYSYSDRDLVLSWISNDTKIEYLGGKVQVSGFQVEKMEGKLAVRKYSNGEKFQVLIARVTLKRTFTYSLYRAYVPSTLLVVLTWSTFWIPPSAVPARVTIIVTNFLSTVFIIQEEGSKIVKVNYTTAMDIFLFANIFFIISSMIEYLLILNWRDWKKEKKNGDVYKTRNGFSNGIVNGVAFEGAKSSNGEMKKKCDKLEMPETEQKVNMEKTIFSSHFIDRRARFIAPILYLIFLSSYSGYYLKHYFQS